MSISETKTEIQIKIQDFQKLSFAFSENQIPYDV